MNTRRMLTMSTATAVLAVLAGAAISAQDRYTLKVPDGLAFSEFQGYEKWQFVSISQTDDLVAVVLANPLMLETFQAGFPENGKPVPDGARMAKVHWKPVKSADAPAATIVPGALHDVDFMVKDSKRFAASGGWGYAEFDYDVAAETFTPQGSGANCGHAYHTIVASKDYVFTAFPKR